MSGVDTAPFVHLMDRKVVARIDLKSAKLVSDVNLGDVVEVCIIGKIRSMSGPREYMGIDWDKGSKSEKEKKMVDPGSLEIEIQKLEVEIKSEWEDPEDD